MTTYVEPSYNTGILHPVRTASHQHKIYMGTLSRTYTQPTDAPSHRNGSTNFKKLMCKWNTTSKRLENITTLTPTNSQISMLDLVWLSSIHKQGSGRHTGPSLQSVHTASTTSKPKVAEFLFATSALYKDVLPCPSLLASINQYFLLNCHRSNRQMNYNTHHRNSHNNHQINLAAVHMSNIPPEG